MKAPISKMIGWVSLAVLILSGSVILPSTAFAFKIGTDPYSKGHSNGTRIDLIGDPVHEDMVWESISLAKEEAGSMSCKMSSEAIASYLDLSNSKPPQKLSHGLCCHKGAKSKVCDLLEADGKWPEFYTDATPLISGVRWNDDICHMSYDDRTQKLWGIYWMNGLGVKRFNNSNFSSHFHEQQFLHAMAPASVYDPSGYRLPTSAIQKRIEIWAKLAFKIAEGKISTDSSLEEAFNQIDSDEVKTFELSFSHQQRRRSVSFLFTGLNHSNDTNDAYIRQMALGALMHTVQDSFSSSHVQRESDDVATFKTKVGSKGKIRRYHTYGIQSPSKHGVADHRPVDLPGARPGDFHPVSLGAELLACAAAGENSTASKWPEAKVIIDRIFKKSKDVDNCAANAGRAYVAQGQSDTPDVFLIEGTVEPTHCRW